MLFQLLGYEMILGDHQLLFIGIGAQLNDLHTIQQRSRNSIQGIGGGDEHHVGQVEGNFNIVIPIGAVLLPVQDLQQGGAGVATVIGAHFVDFIQEDDRVHGPRLGHGSHDPSGHSAYIGLPVAADVRLVMDTAQGDADHFSVQAPGNGIGNGRLANTGRAHQAKDLVLALRGHFPNSHGFQDPFLYLFHAEMVVIQDLSGSGNIHPLLCLCIPGQVQHRIQVISENGSLRGTEGLFFQLICVLDELFLLLLGKLEGLDPRNVLIELFVFILFSQLLPDSTHLLSQIIVPLILIHAGPGLILNFSLQL